jgi:hypothetical protein
MSNLFNLVPGTNDLIDPQTYLPIGGNYSILCHENKVVQCIPNYINPISCVMTCRCPKLMTDSNIKYYPASIKYNLKTDYVSTSNDGRIYIG